MKRRLLIAAVTAASVLSPAIAADDKANLAGDFYRAAGWEAVIAQACRPVVGDGWYNVVQQNVIGQLAGMGFDHDESLLREADIEDQAKVFASSKQSGFPFPAGQTNDQKQVWCLNEINQTEHNAELAAARVRQSDGAN